MKVLKFGGTSVGTVESLKNLKGIVDGLDSPAIVIVSALGGLTDKLISTAESAVKRDPEFRENVRQMAKRHYDIIEEMVPSSRKESVLNEINPLLEDLSDIYEGVYLLRDLSEKTMNRIVSFGERMSSIIVANLLEDAVHADSLGFMKTEKWFDKNIAARQETETLIKDTFSLPLKRTVVAGGFISRDKESEEITNLGRGGSDYTAALIAAALDADILEIWTDVDGFMTADPRIIPNASIIDNMSFIESMELCSYGAKVIYPPTIYPVFHKNIPIKILNTHNPEAKGTLITDDNKDSGDEVRGVSSLKDSAIIKITGELASNVPEISSRTYNAMTRKGINISLVSNPDEKEEFSMTLSRKDVKASMDILKDEFAPELQSGKINDITAEDKLAVIAVVKENIRELKGLGARLTNTLQRDGIKVKAISDGTSETTIALIVDEEKSEQSLRLIHSVCFNR